MICLTYYLSRSEGGDCHVLLLKEAVLFVVLSLLLLAQLLLESAFSFGKDDIADNHYDNEESESNNKSSEGNFLVNIDLRDLVLEEGDTFFGNRHRRILLEELGRTSCELLNVVEEFICVEILDLILNFFSCIFESFFHLSFKFICLLFSFGILSATASIDKAA